MDNHELSIADHEQSVGDAELFGDDAELFGDDAELFGDDAELSGGDAELLGGDSELLGGDSELSGGDAELSGAGAEWRGDGKNGSKYGKKAEKHLSHTGNGQTETVGGVNGTLGVAGRFVALHHLGGGEREESGRSGRHPACRHPDEQLWRGGAQLGLPAGFGLKRLGAVTFQFTTSPDRLSAGQMADRRWELGKKRTARFPAVCQLPTPISHLLPTPVP